MYLVVGGLFGWLRDIEERKTTDLRQLSPSSRRRTGRSRSARCS